MFDWLLYSSNDLSFEVMTEDNQKRHVYLNYKVKRNYNWFWYCKFCNILDIDIISVVRYYFYTNKSAYWHEGESRFRIIDDRKLSELNKNVNMRIQQEINHPKGIIVKDIKITHII